jgi:hypothetical protein
MNRPWITGAEALTQRLSDPAQVAPDDSASGLPPYLESFLAHLRMLVGVPFAYLVPDPRFLPPESIRFFHLDRSWTDRLVDGAIAVGKIGTREQAHHQAISSVVASRLDRTERVVRSLQRGVRSFDQAKTSADSDPNVAGPITGFLLRSVVVSGWPDLEVRAFRRSDGALAPLTTLRLEQLQATVLVALFDGVPDVVWCEEPHHGVPFGIPVAGPGAWTLATRDATGLPIAGAPTTTVPMRVGGRRVIAVAELRRRLHARHLADPSRVPSQTGSAALAISVLAPPWRQRFEGAGAHAFGGLVPVVAVAAKAADPGVKSALEEVAQ